MCMGPNSSQWAQTGILLGVLGKVSLLDRERRGQGTAPFGFFVSSLWTLLCEYVMSVRQQTQGQKPTCWGSREGGGGEETWVPAGIVGEPDHPSGLPASRLVFNQRCCYYLLLLSVLPQQSLTDDEVSLIFGRPQNNFFQLCGYKIRTLQVLRQCIRSPQELMLPLGAPQREKKHHLAIERFFCWFVQRLLAHAMGIKLIWKLPFRWMIWR